ncbi:hypothetical protein EXIGLDRAFT_757391 [Exidia glandulosa HHB12029]|uniref:F-box domain-containing protein n=1 Tax=Exidia glandulosa HHB12029 TaxID=1314781 RepID=A0A166N7H7_EXIGL|nr:hypothetical protein EXIGLDRAFT_757391 [Exidia glandulosa HHB12029]
MARVGPVTIHDLPAEVISHAFSYLNTVQLIYAARVCRQWRDLGLEHPTFWKNLAFGRATSGMFALLKARMNQGRGRPCHLRVVIVGTHPLIIPVLIRELLPAIMPRALTLEITLDADYDQELSDILKQPAPKLVEFARCSQVPLVPEIFGTGTTSKLEILRLVGAPLPEVTIPAIRSITTLSIHHYTPEDTTFPPATLEQLQHLTSLTFSSPRVELHTPLSANFIKLLTRLNLLEFYCPHSIVKSFIQAVPSSCLSAIRTVRVLFGGELGSDLLHGLLTPLRSPFHLAIQRADTTIFSISLQDERSGFVRTFVEPLPNYYCKPDGNEMANSLFRNVEIASQLSTVTVSVSVWPHLIPYLRNFSSVGTLIVEYDWLSDYAPRPQRLPAFPFPGIGSSGWSGLTTLVLQSRRDFIDVNALDVLAFLDLMIAQRCKILELRRVRVIDKLDLLSERFKSVVSFAERLWPSEGQFTPGAVEWTREM